MSIGHLEESPSRIEPARIDTLSGDLPDLLAEVAAKAEGLGRSLHPRTAANLADLVRLMNTYYSNLIEGHNTRPRDIERALAGARDEGQRDLQQEAVAHYRLQEHIDRQAAEGTLPDPADPDFIRNLHREFYADASAETLTIRHGDRSFLMIPGQWRATPDQDVQVGNHLPPASDRMPDFMDYFHLRFAFEPASGRVLQGVGSGKAKRILAMATAHHRFNWIHPFPDGNGRVSRLMSHAMAHKAGIGAHGLWSISRGLARGLQSALEGRNEYKRHMAWADEVRQGDRDGRGHLSLKGLEIFATWFLRVCLDQLAYMSDLFQLDALSQRLIRYVALSPTLPTEATRLLQEALIRGEFERGEAERITQLPERSARRVLKQLTDEGLLASETPKGPVSLRFPSDTLEILFPRLYA
ncbi:Fic family protein [Sphingobium bisphenolivorans]|uniref:Fic family protein n=1 Tax=Sphingobium bisphenolivorans TaxID=1335760 RepID=UPI0003B329F8|nr:Fic family protein [Sphingobium bisphenolivorans]